MTGRQIKIAETLFTAHISAQAMAANLSLLTTAKRQECNPVELFQKILLHGSDTPITDLYKPSDVPVWDSS